MISLQPHLRWVEERAGNTYGGFWGIQTAWVGEAERAKVNSVSDTRGTDSLSGKPGHQVRVDLRAGQRRENPAPGQRRAEDTAQSKGRGNTETGTPPRDAGPEAHA